MNIIVSSWPASGGSTIALLVSYALKYRYIYAGNVFKYLAARIISDQGGDKLVAFEQAVGDSWDTIWETYREDILANSDRLLLEGKTAGFLQQNKSRVFSIMITANLEARAVRAGTDGRAENMDLLSQRDQEIRKRWQEQYGFDLFSKADIDTNYNLHIDNSNMSIEQTLRLIFLNMGDQVGLAGDFDEVSARVDALVSAYWSKGKSHYLELLRAENLLVTPEDVIADWRDKYADLITTLNPLIRDYVLAKV